MQRKIVLIITYLLFFISLGIGIHKRSTYTNITVDNEYLDTAYVAELPGTVLDVQLLEEECMNAPIILQVKAKEDLEYLFYCGRQLVEVQKIWKGENIQTKQEIYIASERWAIRPDTENTYIERGFINFLEKDKEYLVFLEDEIESDEVVTLRVLDSTIVTPIFSYEEHDNRIESTDGQSTYVPYRGVSENEFFVDSNETEELLNDWKTKMISCFPYSR